MDPRIADYIRANRRKYTREAIRKKLIDAGYSPEDVDATWALESPDPDTTAGEGFWKRFWLILVAVNVAVFLLVGFGTGLFGAIGGSGSILLIILAIALLIGALIAWGAVSVTRPAKLGRGTALAIGVTVPLLVALLVGGTCYALVGGLGGIQPAPLRGTMELSIDPPLDFQGSGDATCQAFDQGSGFSVYAAHLGSTGGRGVSVTIDGGGGRPAGSTSVFILLNPEDGPAEPFASYTDTGGATITFDGSPDGISGTVTFENLGPEPIERPPGESVPDPISGSVSWQCQ